MASRRGGRTTRRPSDGNPDTTPDPSWTPLATTPADPSYPGAHSVISAAAAEVLERFTGRRESFAFSLRSPTLPDVERSFTSFDAAADEAGRSRTYAGVHFGIDDVAGQALGESVARFVRRRTK